MKSVFQMTAAELRAEHKLGKHHTLTFPCPSCAEMRGRVYDDPILYELQQLKKILEDLQNVVQEKVRVTKSNIDGVKLLSGLLKHAQTSATRIESLRLK